MTARAQTAPDAAQSWPNRSLRVVVPFTAGSGTDAVGRLVTERLATQLGQNFVIENRPGAGGTIGMGVVAKANADGYTILVHSSSYTVTPTTYPNAPYDTLRDFSGITPLANLPNVLVVAPAKGIRSVKELVAAAKAKPGSITYASAGAGSATQLNAERFRLGAGFEGVHVPFKGTPEALSATVSREVDWFFAPMVSAISLVQSGRLKALAVGTAKRSDVMPDVPTTVEAGVPGSEYLFWVGLFAPAKTPRPIVDRLHDEIEKIMASAETKQRLDKLGAEPFVLAPAAFDRFLADETQKAQQIVRSAGIKLN